MSIYRTTQKDRLERASREAAEWLLVMNANPGASERRAFVDWVHASPLHLRELLLARMTEREIAGGALERFDVDAVVARVNDEDNVVALHQRARRARRHAPVRAARRHHRMRRWLQVAMAAVLVVLGGLGGWGAWQSGNHGVVYATTLGEPRVVDLADGSVVTMSPSSRIEVTLSSGYRDIWLRSGEADFQVAHDKSRPFRVHAGASVIQAVGTRFTVNRLPSGTVVTVTEGVVKLSSGHLAALDSGIGAWLRSWQPTDVDTIKRPGAELESLRKPRDLRKGESAHIARNGRELAVSRKQPVASTDFARRLLMFHDDSLADIAAAFNRYNAVQIEVEGEAARKARFSGLFDSNDASSFLDFLRCCSRLSVTREGERTVVRRAAGKAAER